MYLTPVAQTLIQEIPVTQLRRVLSEGQIAPIDPSIAAKGDWCGGGCGGSGGNKCGFSCAFDKPGVDVIDPEGRLGLNLRDIQSIRENMPALRKEVMQQLALNIENLRT